MRRIYENVHAKVGDQELIELALLREMARGADSKWAAYLAMLPTSIPLSSSFSPTELAALQDESAAAFAQDRQRDLRSSYHTLKERIWVSLGDVPPSQRQKYSSFESFVWASSIITSRMLSLRGHVHLVPFADMFWYSPNPVRALPRHTSRGKLERVVTE